MGFLPAVSKTVSFLILGFLLLINCSVLEFGSHAQVLPIEEVQILRTIANKLNISGWTINQGSCGSEQWNQMIVDRLILTNVSCNCSFTSGSGTVCHVTTFILKGLNLTGVLPEELGNLTQVQEIDLSRNYISGSIPTSLAQLRNLRILFLLGNRFNGSIPREIGSIATLESLVLEDNLLGGPLPQDLGNLINLQSLRLSANNFTGRIPETFGNLKNLSDFRIDGNVFSGKIPEFIGNWTNMTRLDMHGTSMEGPIPSAISLLTNLTTLQISDLKGPSSPFPNLQGMKKMVTLILRSCLISDSIPEYLGDMTQLKVLDLSNNMLTGSIPGPLQSLEKMVYTFLNNNSLTGIVPDWMLSSTSSRFRDLSYNNFIGSRDSRQLSCQQLPVNLASSHPTSNSVSWCLSKDLPCPRKQQYHSLFINCGGKRMHVGDNEYEEDLTPGSAASFVSGSDNWAYSSTGLYINRERAPFIADNRFNLAVTGEEFYQTARLAPQSLKYYALCMRTGSYKVKLHFAEIMYSNDRTFSSIGQRIFDISIQGNVVLEDFNIMEVAGGVGIGIFKEFDNIQVNGSTMEIHLYWKGKGTTAIPDRGVYGPLLSAIEIHPKFEVDTGKGWSIGAIVGTVAACVVVILLVLLVLRMRGYLGGEKDVVDEELRGLDLQTGHFTLRQIKRATNNFDPAHKIGEGGFGPVYKGVLSDGTVIAVKQLSSKSKQGNREFVNEIGMISALQHPNLVRLYGCCIEGKELLLVYEYLENNSLARALFGREDQQMTLVWLTRKKILMGIAKGLCFLHEESRLKIVHRDIKATNVLLDKDLNAKISDFGLAKLDEEENTHISTRIAGTIGYMAPEYAMRGYLTDKADVYSFGVVVLEIVSGRCNTNYRPKEEFVYLLDWAYVLQEQENLLELVDPKLGTSYSKKEALKILNIGLLCTNPSPTLRPSMSSVVGMLDGKIAVKAPIVKHDTMNQDARFKAFEILSQDSQTNLSTFSKENLMHKSNSTDAPWTDSSISLPSHDETRDNSSSSRLLKDLDDQ